MNSSISGKVPEYLGGDLTDRYSSGCRDIDLCGLTPIANNRLAATFWYWSWDAAPKPLDVTVIAAELTAARTTMLDGPQGLATAGTGLRACERQSAAVGKTPDRRPDLAEPFAGFICSSLDIFAALKRAGIPISPPSFVGGVSEVYPGHIWTVLSAGRALPKKSTERGRLARKHLLEALGVCGLPGLPTHDQNDACVAALLAAAADGKVAGMTTRGIGSPLFSDPNGTLREGPMVVPDVTAVTAALISQALRNIPLLGPGASALTVAASGQPDNAANDLFEMLIARALEGNPQVCTYAWAYRRLFSAPT